MSNASFFDRAESRLRTGLAEVNKKWGWYFALGAFLIILGVFAAGSAVFTTLLTVTVLGWVLLFAGAGLIIHSFLTGRWSGFLLSLAAGALSAMAGIAMLAAPLSGAVAVTLLMGAILIGAGIYRSISSIVMQFPRWGWALISGIVSIGLGSLLIGNLPSAGLYFLGLYVGIDLMIHGFSWIMFSLGVHSLAREFEIKEADRRAA